MGSTRPDFHETRSLSPHETRLQKIETSFSNKIRTRLSFTAQKAGAREGKICPPEHRHFRLGQKRIRVCERDSSPRWSYPSHVSWTIRASLFPKKNWYLLILRWHRVVYKVTRRNTPGERNCALNATAAAYDSWLAAERELYLCCVQCSIN